ncbi:MAG: BtpA/SgcQ family protein [Phycisphaerales bacterium]|nr:BtpA/SgcQ family protein [Phycisphaerales bacterium]MCB9836422.1 BtpA/SgcQ family protein [Phycisphaera sp.]
MAQPRINTPGSDFLKQGNVLIGMVHVGATPGTPRASQSPTQLVEQARTEAKTLRDAGFDAVIVENMHDAPYVHGDDLGPEQTAVMTLAAQAVREAFGGPVGVQILSGGNRQALAAAHATGASFIRCENFVFSHVADEGLLAKAEAGPLLRYRRQIGADSVAVLADIKKKHASHTITADISITEAVEAAQFFGVDGVIVTGPSTGKPTDIEDLKAARAAADVPVLVGSGVTPESVQTLLKHAHALIVGSWIKSDGKWFNAVDPARARAIVQAR